MYQAEQAEGLVIKALSITPQALVIIIPMLVFMLLQVQQEVLEQTVQQVHQEVLEQSRAQPLELEEQVDLRVREVDWF